ncbi:MAG: RidA family protein [Acidobacteria bacterium]|nr:RidA family protein [Acidobacteriota bacterium]
MQNKLEYINPAECGAHPGYSHGIKTQQGSLLFIAGQVGWDEHAKMVSAEFAGQFEKALSNLLAVVREAGGRPENVVRLTIYAVDRNEYLASLKPVGQAYRKLMGKHYPAMTFIEVKGLVEEGAKLELEATAVL